MRLNADSWWIDYIEVATHFRAIRVTEIQKMEDRAKGGKQEFRLDELAADAWDGLDLEDLQPLAEWLKQQTGADSTLYEIPADRPIELTVASIFEAETVYFGKRRKRHVVCPSKEVAEFIAEIAHEGFSGPCVLPSDPSEVQSLAAAFRHRQSKSIQRMAELVQSRTTDMEKQKEILGVMRRWFIFGRHPVESEPDGFI